VLAVLLLTGTPCAHGGDEIADEMREYERTVKKAAALIRAVETGIEPKEFEAQGTPIRDSGCSCL